MKYKAGIGMGLLVSLTMGWAVNYLAGTRRSVPAAPQATNSKGSGQANNPSPVTKPTNDSTLASGCTAYETPDPKSKDENLGEAQTVIDRFTQAQTDANQPDHTGTSSLEYVIALVPDPRHTRLSMLFDRSIDAIEDAAQDEQFTYDSFWLPWRIETHTYGSRDDVLAARKSMEAREECPGVMLFRRSARWKTPSDAPYQKGLFVFVVGEQPTGGLNSKQWDFAIQWLARFGHLDGSTSPLRVLGPLFSGTLPSLLRKLQMSPFSNSTTNTYVFSGTVGSCPSVEWFWDSLKPNIHARFLQENDELQLHRFLDYLTKQGEELSHVAILSEDETAYGGSLEYTSEQDPCNLSKGLYEENKPLTGPVALFYPRDISAMRSAYQAQSIFSQGLSEATGKQSPRTVLSDDLGTEGAEEGDTPASYNNQRAALTEEAVLYGLVSLLRAHHTHYIALRGSNPLDYVFLTRFLHHAFPEGRVVTVGSEVLFTRELDTTEFRGAMALTNFPLMPRSQHWSQLWNPHTNHAHRVFSSNSSEGLYLAARFLIDLNKDGETQLPKGRLMLSPLKEPISDFADPYWLQDRKPPLTKKQGNSWLTVLGRNGYWPIAILYDTPEAKPGPPPTEAMPPTGGGYDPTSSMGMNPPMSWFLAIILSSLLLGWHSVGCCNLRRASWLYPFRAFRAREGKSFKFLIGASTAFAFAIPVVLFAPFWPWWIMPSWNAPLIAWFYWILLQITVLVVAIICLYSKLPHGVRRAFSIGALCSALAIVVLCNVNSFNNATYYYRAINLTDGVTPLLPLLFLLGGLYIWTWQNLAGDALLGRGRPELPPCQPEKSDSCPQKHSLSWKYPDVSARRADRIDHAARPLSWLWQVMVPPTTVAVICLFCFWRNPPVLSLLEGSWYRWIVNLTLFAVLLLIASGTARLFWTWKELKRLLLQLGRMPLCRTFGALRDISARSLWAMSGHVPGTQYTFFSQQMDALKRLRHELGEARCSGPIGETLIGMLKTGEEFSRSYLANPDERPQWDQPVKMPGDQLVRPLVADTAAIIFNEVLDPSWEKEAETTDCLVDRGRVGSGAKNGSSDEEKGKKTDLPLSQDGAVLAAEEFMCLLYISYIQNILARMRTMVYSMSALYASTMLAVAFYPFAARPLIAIWMLLALTVLSVVVAIVYAGLERDEILSRITKTSATIGREFMAKYAVFLLPPLLALLAAQFPEIADSVLGWIQPGLEAAK